jgi:nicotinate phosphoribosyltransferase
MINGKRVKGAEELLEISKYCRSRMAKLPEEYKRFDNPHIYKVGLSERLRSERDRLINNFKK